MPNWCYTDITITGEKKDIKLLHDELEKATSRNYINNGFGTSWLGNVVEYMGHSYEDVLCRGIIDDMQLSDGRLDIFIETAWGPQMEPIIMMLDHLGLTNKTVFTFTAIEEGCGMYDTNDASLVGLYLVENGEYMSNFKSQIQNWEYEYVPEKELKDALCLELDMPTETDINVLIDAFQEKHLDVCIHQFEYRDPDDYL